MKKKVLALFLALAMAVSLVTPALAVEGGLVDSVTDFIESTTTGKEKLLQAKHILISLGEDMKKEIDEATVNLFQKTELVVNDLEIPGVDFQWQIKVPDLDLWVDIYDQTEGGVDLSYAMIANMLDDNDQAKIRCEISLGSFAVQSPEITVDVDDVTEPEPTPVEEQDPVVLEDSKVEIHDDDDSDVTEEPVIPEDPAEPETPSEPETPAEPEPSDEEANVIDQSGLETTATAVTYRAANLSASTRNGIVVANNTTTYNVVINYVFENNEIVADPYTATLAAGSNFSATVTFPVVQGYLPYVNETQQDSIDLNYTDISQDDTYNVVYKPTNVNYTVIHYKQNVDNDNYTEAERETKQGLTNSTVPDVAKTYEGFYALLYEKPTIAADGSTVVEIYYDRYYYLMNFDLDGGYGVEPIYARYGTPIEDVGTPTKAGYVFGGWTLNGETANIPSTMPAENQTYKAKWGTDGAVDYTVVYWKENANDSNYSFWGQVTKQAVAGTTVSGADDIPDSITTTTVDGSRVNEKVYFTYNGAKTNKNVVVKGDGTTVVNVYYYRNTYHLYFTGISGKCAIEEHAHGDGNCNSYLDCLQTEHTHDETCERVLSCTLPVHEHAEVCYGLVCEIPEHAAHTADCLICTKAEHSEHSSSCCSIPEHSHSDSCCKYGGTNFIHWWHSDNCCKEGLSEHTHGDGNCSCPLEVHMHSEANGCYADTLHTHDDSCYGLTCGQAAHTHTDSCYTYTCGAEDHTHTSSCYRPCTKLVHTHTDQCNQDSDKNVIYVISAKYEQNIADVWPTAEKFSNYTLKGWTIDDVGKMAVSKRVSMTADLCDTSDNLKYAEANNGGTVKTLYYMFESFDQTSGENGDQRKLLNGTYYDSDSRYYQQVNSSGSWSQKPIEGMKAVNDGVKYNSDKTKVYLYYTRNRSDLMFHNSSDGIVETVSGIMYEQPLVSYQDNAGNLLSAFTPSYPSKLEPNAYRFVGWYTSPECYDGTEFNFSTATMPNGDLTLYAKWVPVNHTVEFYLDKGALDAGTKLNTHPDITVPHGSLANPTPANPTNGNYEFVGWFYMDNGVEKAFDFANMPVTKDLQVYGKWSSKVLKAYTIYYKYKDSNGDEHEIADPITGSGLAGATKTFEAKGGTDLYADYQEGYFPVTKSHSLTIDINATEENDTNVYTFEYVKKDSVPYIVRYVDESGNALTGVPEKVVSENVKAVVTENFVPVAGMMPDAYQKRLVVTGSDEPGKDQKWITVTVDGEEIQVHPENVITFVYKEDTQHAYYKITHYTQNTDGETWTEYATSQAVGDIGTRYTGAPLTISGFTYNKTEYKANGQLVTDVTDNGAILTSDGLEINLYYVRNEYPYEVHYLDKDTGEQLIETVEGSAPYGKLVSGEIQTIPGYSYVSANPSTGTKTIEIENDPTTAVKNIITLYYKKSDVDLVIQKTGADSRDKNQSFIFRVTGSNGFSMDVVIVGNDKATIKSLPAGDYTVTELTDWSWRYKEQTPQTVHSTDAVDGKMTVTFTNVRKDPYWLSGDCWCENWWAKNSVVKRDKDNNVLGN